MILGSYLSKLSLLPPAPTPELFSFHPHTYLLIKLVPILASLGRRYDVTAWNRGKQSALCGPSLFWRCGHASLILTVSLGHYVSPSLGLELPVPPDPQAFFLLVSDKPLILRIRVRLINLGHLWVRAYLHSSDTPSSGSEAQSGSLPCLVWLTHN